MPGACPAHARRMPSIYLASAWCMRGICPAYVLHMPGLCPPILHNGWARQASDWRSYHCWITERTIPLDGFVQCPMANRSQCTLAAFICVLECVSIGLQISDTHFFNFGVRFFSDFATEHVVVLIDAGSRGLILLAGRKKKSPRKR